jgi:DHA2 family multidrug resistance protein-like MFS transporter
MESIMTTTALTRSAGRKEWTALAVLALPLLLVSMDVSVLYFAVPFISADLHPTATQQLWLFDIYGFVLAGLLITMGAIGDRIGRRRLLFIGAVAFGIASVAAAYAQTPAELIGARAVLGIGGATLMPSTLALIRNMFHDPGQRAKAIAIWTAVLTGGVALGPVLSGVLLEHFWWGSVFLMSTPAMALLLLFGPVLLPEHRSPQAAPSDVLGSVLSLGAVLPTIYGVKRLAVDGIGVLPVVCLVTGVLIGWAFVLRQRHAAVAMIDLVLFRNRRFSGSLLANTVAMFALVGNAVFMTQYLQLTLGMSPLRAALWSLVPSVAVAAAAPAAVALARSVGAAAVTACGFGFGATGFLVLTQVHRTSPLVVVIVGAGLLAIGAVSVMTLVTELVVGTVSPARAGAASALSETSSELGGALGIAVLGSIGTAVYHAKMASEVPSAAVYGPARESLAGALGVATHLSEPAGGALVNTARDAFTAGLDFASLVGAVLLTAAAALAATLLRSTDRMDRASVRADEPAEEGHAVAQ